MSTNPSPDAPGQWPAVARNWPLIGPPLRPSPEDCASFAAVLDCWTAAHTDRAPRGLILGVTPELHALAWPDRSLLRAADRTEAMIRHIWPGEPEAALMTDWRSLTITDRSMDIVMCDGGLHLLDYPRGQQALCAELARILAPGGLVAFRLFVPPERPETPEAVLHALRQGAIRDLNCLKLRLGMALQTSPQQGVALAEVWHTLRGEAPEGWSELATRLGWRLDELSVIDAYRESGARYHFVSTAQAIDLFRRAGLRCIEVRSQPYLMGEQCPVVIFGT